MLKQVLALLFCCFVFVISASVFAQESAAITVPGLKPMNPVPRVDLSSETPSLKIEIPTTMSQPAVVEASGVRLRTKPDAAKPETILDLATPGQSVTILGIQGDWAKVQTQSGGQERVLYMPSKYLNASPEAFVEAVGNKLRKFNEEGVSCRPTKEASGKKMYNGFSDTDLEKDHQLGANSYGELMGIVRGSKSYKECLNKVSSFISSSKAVWGKLDFAARRARIHAHALRVFDKLSSGKTQGYQSMQVTNVDTSYKAKIDPYYIDPAMSPAALTCIAFQETKPQGHFSPHDLNGDYCANFGGAPKTSTAQSLNMSTLKTYRDSSSVDGVNQIPLELQSSQINKMKPEDKWKTQGDSPSMQMEAMFRILNMKIKERRASLRKNSNAEMSTNMDVLMQGVLSYGERHDKYVNNVGSCIDCFNQGKSVEQCYTVLAMVADKQIPKVNQSPLPYLRKGQIYWSYSSEELKKMKALRAAGQ